MIVGLYKEKDVEVDLENLVNFLNQLSKNITFRLGKEKFIIGEQELSSLKIGSNYISKEIEKEIENDDFSLFISNKPFEDSYFFHEIENKNLLSLFGWEDLTNYSKNTGVVYFILWILALDLDNTTRHLYDANFTHCIYNFAGIKAEINTKINSAIICDDCQNRLSELNDKKKELIYNELQILLDVLDKSKEFDNILKYWKSIKKEKVKIFFSYAHKDREYLEEFKEYIKIFERNELVERWDDNELIVGEKWDNSIKEKIYSADIIIFLLSSTSLASDYIYNHELKIAFELKEMEESYVVPIIIKECLWDMTEFSEFQILPLDGKAVNSWTIREEAWTSVSRGLKKAIDNIIQSKQDISEKLEQEKKEFVIQKTNNSISEKELILKFLQLYSRWWFNIPRMINWGSERKGFESLKKIEINNFEKFLDELIKDKKVKVKINEKNTSSLFKIV
jgi:hypothetical protein